MKTTLTTLALVLLVAVGAFAGGPAVDGTAAVEAVTVAPATLDAPADLAALRAAVFGGATVDPSFDFTAKAWPGNCTTSPPCSRDSQCDSYCGGVGFGACGSKLCCLCRA